LINFHFPVHYIETVSSEVTAKAVMSNDSGKSSTMSTNKLNEINHKPQIIAVIVIGNTT